MIHKMLALPLLILMGSFVMAEDKPEVLFDFTGADAAKEWQTVNDGVMGGVSEGKFKITDREDPGVLRHAVAGEQRWLCFGADEGQEARPGKRRHARRQGSGRWPGVFAEPVPQQAADCLLVPGHGADEEGRMDRGQSAARQVRSDFVRAGRQGRRCGKPRGGQRRGLPAGRQEGRAVQAGSRVDQGGKKIASDFTCR